MSSSSCLGSSSMCSCKPREVVKEVLALTNPRKHKVIDIAISGNYTIAFLQYEGEGLQYEGKKILVYQGIIADDLTRNVIDPHFCEQEECISPLARFEPTPNGWGHACHLVMTATQIPLVYIYQAGVKQM